MSEVVITEEMLAACQADCAVTRRAYRSIIRKNVAARLRTTFGIEEADYPAIVDQVAEEVLRRMGH